MKKVICSLLWLLMCAGTVVGQQSAESLVAESAAFLKDFFKNRFDIRVAVVRFENDSELTDTAMQKLYQLLISRLENDKNIRISDLLVNFTDGLGEFNLGRVDELHYLLDLKLIQNKSKTGLGLTIFSRLQDKIVSVKYFEKDLSKGEMDLLNAKIFAFSELGFSKLLEFESKKNLMDIKSLSAGDGRDQYFFYYPDEIIVYLANNMRLEKDSQLKLGWTRPVYPVLHYEGKLLLLRTDQGLVMTAGNNFSPYAKFLVFRDNQWQEIQKIDFVPCKYLVLNQKPYLAGARYEEGRNYFKDKIYFMPFSDPADRTGMLEKKAVPALDLDFSIQEGQLQAVHLIDRSYAVHLFTSEFEEQFPTPEKKGASLAALGGEWLAVSDYTRASDQLFFYDIQSGGQRLVYSKKITGEIQFISAGTWQNTRGFWTGVRQERDGRERFMVQFWENAMAKTKLLLLPLALLLIFAIKPYYGGEITIRLNEPTSFTLNTANYSNLIFYSLIYENFFYLKKDGEIFSNVFQEYRYDAGSKTLTLTIKDNLSFSNGKPLTARNIQVSLKIFMNANLFAASKLSKTVKNVRVNDNQVRIELLTDNPDILSLLSAPELVVLAENEQSFSGMFFPQEWEKNHQLVLKANPFYAGGRTYLDRAKITFSESTPPDLFLASPNQFKENFWEFDSGIFQNIYLCFLQNDMGQNTKIALFTILKRFNEATGNKYKELQTLTSDEESPVSIRIKTMSAQKTASILKYSEIKLYILTSLSNLEKDLAAFLKNSNLKIETLFIDDSQLMAFLNSAAIQYLLIDKIFQKKVPAEEKISRILKETSFNQFNAKYLRMLSELDEVRFSNSQELLMEQIARISETIVNDGFIFPLFQKNYSLYLRKLWPAMEIDYYGRPLLQKVSKNND